MALLREYQFLTTKRGNLTVELVDPLRNPARARDLQAQYRFSGGENVIVVEYGGRSTVIPAPEMGEYDTAPTEFGERPRLVAFRGEQVLTSAFIGLAQPSSAKKTYFLQGHGEGLPGVPPMQIIGQNLKRQNITIAPLNLAAATGGIPSDAALVVIAGAHFDLSPDELAALRTYWQTEGHLLVLLDSMPSLTRPASDPATTVSCVLSVSGVPREFYAMSRVNSLPTPRSPPVWLA